ncbi:MAG: chloride channel protein [Atopobiaceae bacterium]|jgi:H+/Cl- antiporter ClcA
MAEGHDAHSQRFGLKRGRCVAHHLTHRYQVNLVGQGALVGLAGGAVVSAYRFALSHAESLLRTIISAAAKIPFGMLGWFVVLLALCFIVGRLMVWEPNTQGSGIPQVDAEVAAKLDAPWHRVLCAKFVEGTLCAFGGLSLGREGPSVQLGGMAGKGVAKLLGRRRGEERLLVTCGAAAGMSAAFHAPLTGVLFAIEEIHKEFTAPLIISVMTASVVSDFLVSQVLGVRPVLVLSFLNDIPHRQYAVVLLMGLYTGILGVLHNKGMFYCQDRLYKKIQNHLPYARLAIPFVLSGIIAFSAPALLCGGDAIIEMLLSPNSVQLPLLIIVGLLIGKYLFTTLSFGSGAPGGTLFPLVVMGMLSGAVYAYGYGIVMGEPTAYINSFIVLGVAGLFASVVRAPVTAVVLVFELTGSLDALLATSIVSIISYVTANLLNVDPFYEHLYANLIGIGAKNPEVQGTPGEKELQTYVVGAGSAAEGKLIRDIPWPDDVLVVTIERGGQEILPRGNTQLMALDTLTIIQGVETADATNEFLRNLTQTNLTDQQSAFS